jgi:hypothetical protein
MKKTFTQKLKKPDKIGKFVLSLFTVILLIGFSQKAYSQEIKLNIKMEKVTLGEILQEIKKQSHKNILYNNKNIDIYKNESINVANSTLENALNKCLEGKNLKYKVVDDVIIIEPDQQRKKSSQNSDDKTKTINTVIKGRVVEKNTEIPIAGAIITINDSTSQQLKGTTSDIDGYFRLTNNSTERVNIRVSFMGYKPVKLDNIQLRSGKELMLNIELEESITEIKAIAIVLRKDKPINDMATVSARAFTIEETERFAGSLGVPARMATNYAGVFTAGDQRNDIIIRGNSPTGLLWQLEDVPIPSPNHFSVFGTTGGPISMINNNLLARSDFFTSAFPSEFGNATSGVFDLKMRNGNFEKNEFLLQAGFNGFEGGAEGPISRKNKSSYIVNARYSMLGLVQDLLYVDGLPKYEDLSFKLNFPLKSGKVSIFGLGGLSDISIKEDDYPREDAINKFELKNVNNSKTGVLGVNYLHNFNSGKTTLKTAIAVSAQNTGEDVDSTMNKKTYMNLDDNSYSQNELTLTSKLTRKLNTKNTVSLGLVLQNMSFESERMTSDYDNLKIVIDKPYSTSSKSMVLSQLYTQWKHNFSDYFFINAGVNANYFFFNNTSAIDPRIGLSWQVNEKNNVGFGYGLHSQIQPLNVYFIQSKIGIDSTGKQVYADLKSNKNLDFTKSNQFALSHNYSFNSNLRLKTEIYFQYLYNVPVKTQKGYFSMINAGAAQSVPEEDSLINKGYGRNYGIELTFEKFLSQNYYFLITTSLFDSRYKGADKIWRNTTYNGNYILNVLGGYELEIKKNIVLNTNLRTVFAGGRRLIPYDLQRSIEENGTHYMYDHAYEKQAKSYFRMDIRIGLIFQRPHATHEFAFDMSNITNHKNVYRERYDEFSKKPKISYMQGIFPMGLYRLNF